MSNAQNIIVYESTASYATIWTETNWKKVYKYVDKQRFRIFRAESEGDYRKVRDLQRILINSPAALKVAIKRVTQINKGRKTAGLDGFRALTDAQRGKLFVEMKDININKHKPTPVKRIQIPKKNGKTRPLGIPVIIDRVIQELLRIAMEPQWEFRFEPISYGFRPARRVHDAMMRIFYDVRRGNFVHVFEGDFKSCFNTLNHDFILKQIKGFPYANIVKKFLKAGYVEDNIYCPTTEGTPQGGLLSPLLANIALHGLEECLDITYKEKHGKDGCPTYVTHGKYRVVRYADDFLIFATNGEDLKAIPDILQPYLEDRGLILAEDKTNFTTLYKGFDFLGFNVRMYNGKCLIKPSRESLKEARAKIREIFRMMRGHNVKELTDALNPVITGIAEFWKPMVSKKSFTKIDNYIWKKIWKFLKHLHHNKSHRWIVKKYFPIPNKGDAHQDKWILTDPKTGKQLIKMSWTKIKRHAMIKHNHSPLDKSKIFYFKKRWCQL